MAVGTATLLTTALSVAGTLYSGYQQKQAADVQAYNAEQSSIFAANEAGRVAAKQAAGEKEAAEAAEKRQKLAYLKSGVTLEGSPLLIMEETRLKGEENVNEILMGGAAASTSRLTEGRVAASSLQAQGRSAFTGSLFKAAGSAAGGYKSYKDALGAQA